jgi:hypothetical protein
MDPFFCGSTAQFEPDRLIVEVSTSQLDTHTPGRTLWTSDQIVAEAATYPKHNKHKRRTAMPSTGFEPAMPAIKRLQTYALVRTAAGSG